MTSLQRILFKRYGAIIIVLFFLALVFHLSSFSSQFLEWRANEREAVETKVQGKWIGSNLKDSESSSEIPSMALFSKSPDGQFWMSAYFVEPIGWMQLLMMGIVFLILFFDRHSGFDSFLYGSRFSKRSIVKQKILFLGIGTLLVFVVAKCLFWGLVFWKVDEHYMNLPWTIFLKQQLNSLAVSSVYFSLSMFAGFLIGELITGVLTVYFLCITLHDVVSALEELFLTAIGKNWWEFEMETQTITNVMSNNSYMQSQSIGNSSIFFVFAAILLWGAQKLAVAVSLENSQQYLLLPRLRKTVMVSMMLYLMLVQLKIGLFHSSLADLLQGDSSFSHFLGNLLATGVIGGGCSCFLLFRKSLWQGFQKIMFVKPRKT